MPGSLFPKYKVAAVQAGQILGDAPNWFNLEGTLQKTVELIKEAGKNGARLIVFPEGWLPCFPHWSLDFRDRAGFNEIWANFLWNSIEIPGRETEILCSAAKETNAYIVIGINERDKTYAGRMYNSILFIDPQGKIMGTHRKICNTSAERLFHTPGDGGDNLKTVFKTEIGILGGSICGEHHQLPLMYNWIMQGVQVHCSLWPGVVGIGDLPTQKLSGIGHCFSVLSSGYIPEQNQPKNFYSNCRFNIPGSIRGGSGVLHPNGSYIAGPVYDKETIVYADIDLSEIDKSRVATNLTGLYSRWDLLNLNIKQEQYLPIVSMTNYQTCYPEAEKIHELETRIALIEQQIVELKEKAQQ